MYLTPLYACVGLLVGAVINLLADDLPHHRPVRRWRCAACQQPRWFLGVGAWLTGNRCTCGQSYGWRPALVELFTAAVFAFCWLRYGPSVQLILASFYLTVYILVTVTDVEHRLILNTVMLPALALALVAAAFNPHFKFTSALKSAGFAFLILLLMYGLGAIIGRLKHIKGAVFGQGDVTLGVFMGLSTGPAVIYAIAIGILTAGIAALGYVIYQAFNYRRSGLTAFMPYGPFLALGGALMVIWGPAVIAYYAL